MRTHATKQKMSAKKRAAMIAAFVLAAALLLGGAFAWTDLAQSFTNRIRGGASPDVLLHDDFSPLENKDVYVENPGDQPIIVRVSFAEFFQIADTVYTLNPTTMVPTPSDIDDKATWPVHVFPDRFPPVVGTGILGTGAAGEFDGACTSGGPAEEIHDYFAWTMSGDQKWYKKGTSAFGDFDYTPDGETNPQTGATGTYPADLVSGTPGDPAVYSDVALTIGDTAVVTMAYYLDNDATLRLAYPDGFWILDVDGWCYWSELLMPDTATSLLLDNVELRDPSNKPGDNYAYFIDVRLQACNRYEVEDLIEKGGGATPNGEDLLRQIAGTYVPPAPGPELVLSVGSLGMGDSRGLTAMLGVLQVTTDPGTTYEIEVELSGGGTAISSGMTDGIWVAGGDLCWDKADLDTFAGTTFGDPITVYVTATFFDGTETFVSNTVSTFVPAMI